MSKIKTKLKLTIFLGKLINLKIERKTHIKQFRMPMSNVKTPIPSFNFF